MPRSRPPPIRDQKLAAGFTTDEEGQAVYLSWHKAVKREMEGQEILSVSNPGRQQWATLARWFLMRVPLSNQATLYKGT